MLDKISEIFFRAFWLLIGLGMSVIYGDPFLIRKSRKLRQQNVNVVIIGAGISGIAMAKKLNDIGLTDYTILEQGPELGGTWFWNKVQ